MLSPLVWLWEICHASFLGADKQCVPPLLLCNLVSPGEPVLSVLPFTPGSGNRCPFSDHKIPHLRSGRPAWTAALDSDDLWFAFMLSQISFFKAE